MKLKQLFLPILLVIGLLTTSCEDENPILPDLSGTYSGQLSSTWSNCPGMNGSYNSPLSFVITKKSNGKYSSEDILRCGGVLVEIPSNGEYEHTRYCDGTGLTEIMKIRIGSGGKLTWRYETINDNGGCKVVSQGDFYK